MESLGLGIILNFRDNASSRLVYVLGLLKQLRQTLMALNVNSSGLVRPLENIAKVATIAGTALSILGKIASGVFKDMMQDTIKLGMKFEQFLVGLEQLWGGKDIARKKFEEYESIAAQTPFTFEEIMPQAIRAKALGIDPSKKYKAEWKGKEYEASFFDLMMNLYTVRPDKGKDSAGRGLAEYVEGQARPLKWMYGLNDKNILAKDNRKPSIDHEERLKDIIRMEAERNMLGAWEKTEQMFSVVIDNIIGDLHYLAYFINESGFFEQVKKPFLDFYKFLKSVTQEKDKHTMKALGKSISEGFAIIAAPALAVINTLFKFLEVLIKFTAEHPKLVSMGIAIAGLASQVVLLGGILLLVSSAFNFFRTRVIRSLFGVASLKMFFVNAVASVRMFVRSIFPAAVAIGFLYYAFRNNLLGIRSVVDSTLNYIGNFMSVLIDALTHYDLDTGIFSLSYANEDLAQQMGIIDFISAIVTAEGYVLRFWGGFKKGIEESKRGFYEITEKLTGFLEKLHIIEPDKWTPPTPNVKEGERGSKENPIKNNIIYNAIFDQNLESIGDKIGNIALPLALFIGSLNVVKVMVATVLPLISRLGSVFMFLGRTILSIIPLTGRLSRLFTFAPYLRGMLRGIGGLIIQFGGMLLRAFPMIGNFVQIVRYTLAGLLLHTRATLGLYATTIRAFLSPILAKVSQFAWSFARFLVTPIRVGIIAIKAIISSIRAIYSAFQAGTLKSLLGNFFSGLLGRIPLIGRYISYILRTGNALRVLRLAFLSLRALLLANPIGIALLAIGLAVEFIMNHWEQFKNTADDVWNHVTETLSNAWDTIKESFRPVIQLLEDLWKDFCEMFPEAGATIIGVLDWFNQKLTMSDDTAQTVFNAIGTVIKIVFDLAVFIITSFLTFLSGWLQTVLGIFKGLSTFLLGVFTGDWDKAWNGLKQVATAFGNGIKTIIYGIRTALIDLKNGFLESIGVIDSATAKMEHYQAVSYQAAQTNPTVAMQVSSNFNPGGAYAKGGVIEKPEIALIGEAGREVVVPLTRKDSRSRSLAMLAAKETGVMADIINNAQISNSPIGFEVRGMQPMTSNNSSSSLTSNIGNRINNYQQNNNAQEINPVVIPPTVVQQIGIRKESPNQSFNTENFGISSYTNTNSRDKLITSKFERNLKEREGLKVIIPTIENISGGIQRLVENGEISRSYYETRNNFDRLNLTREYNRNNYLEDDYLRESGNTSLNTVNNQYIIPSGIESSDFRSFYNFSILRNLTTENTNNFNGSRAEIKLIPEVLIRIEKLIERNNNDSNRYTETSFRENNVVGGEVITSRDNFSETVLNTNRKSESSFKERNFGGTLNATYISTLGGENKTFLGDNSYPQESYYNSQQNTTVGDTDSSRVIGGVSYLTSNVPNYGNSLFINEGNTNTSNDAINPIIRYISATQNQQSQSIGDSISSNVTSEDNFSSITSSGTGIVLRQRKDDSGNIISPLIKDYEMRGESKWQRRQVTGLDAITTFINKKPTIQGLITRIISGRNSNSKPRDIIISGGNSNAPLPQTNVPMNGSLTGVPSEDNKFLEQMFNNPISNSIGGLNSNIQQTSNNTKEINTNNTVQKTQNVVGNNSINSKTSNKEIKQQNQEIRNWAKNISGNKNSDGVIDLILNNAQNLNYTPEQTKLALALATAESNLNQSARSETGAIGVMQLMPGTARDLGVNPYNTNENIYGGMVYLKQQLDRFGGDWKKAAAAYNAGPGAVQQYGGIPPYRETQNYVAKIGGFLESAPEYNTGNTNIINNQQVGRQQEGKVISQMNIGNETSNTSNENNRSNSVVLISGNAQSNVYSESDVQNGITNTQQGNIISNKTSNKNNSFLEKATNSWLDIQSEVGYFLSGIFGGGRSERRKKEILPTSNDTNIVNGSRDVKNISGVSYDTASSVENQQFVDSPFTNASINNRESILSNPVIQSNENPINNTVETINSNITNQDSKPKKSSFIEKVVSGWKDTQRNVGNFFGGIFGFRKRKNDSSEEKSNPIIPQGITDITSNENNKTIENISAQNTEAITGNSVSQQTTQTAGNISNNSIDGNTTITSNNVSAQDKGLGTIITTNTNNSEKESNNTSVESKEKKSSSFIEKFVSGFKDVQRNVGNFLGGIFGFRKNEENINSKTQSNEQQNTLLNGIKINTYDGEENVLRNTQKTTEGITQVSKANVTEENKTLSKLGAKENFSIIDTVVESFKKILPFSDDDNPEEEKTSPSEKGSPFISPNQPIQPNLPVGLSFPQPLTFNSGVQQISNRPQQQSSPSGNNVAGNESINYNVNATIVVKSELDVKKIVPLIKKELDRLNTTRQNKSSRGGILV